MFQIKDIKKQKKTYKIQTCMGYEVNYKLQPVHKEENR